MSMPEIMSNAREDLTATIEGNFSPQDWHQILKRAHSSFESGVKAGASEQKSWESVIRQFHQDHYWGFVPDYVPPKKKRPPLNLGMKLIIMTLNAMLTFKVLVLWYGQIYSRSDEPLDKWIFFLILFGVVINYGVFLWRHRDHVD